jgi:hypothetical protein
VNTWTMHIVVFVAGGLYLLSCIFLSLWTSEIRSLLWKRLALIYALPMFILFSPIAGFLEGAGVWWSEWNRR